MGEAVIVAIISGLVTLAGTMATVWATSRKTNESFRISQARMEERIASLTEEVRKHNGFAEKIPVLMQRLSDLERRIGELERQIDKN